MRLGARRETLNPIDSPFTQDLISVPTLTRLIIVLAVLAGLGYGTIFALANLVDPGQREITVRVKKEGFGR